MPSINQYMEAFGEFIPQTLLGRSKEKSTALTRIDPYSLRETESLCRGVGRRFLFLEC